MVLEVPVGRAGSLCPVVGRAPLVPSTAYEGARSSYEFDGATGHDAPDGGGHTERRLGTGLSSPSNSK